MQFINIVVHSVEDMNFRVHLQYDFTKLNLDEHLEVTLWRITGGQTAQLTLYRWSHDETPVNHMMAQGNTDSTQTRHI